MEKKLSAQSLSTIDKTIQELNEAWHTLKKTWEGSGDARTLDAAFYKFVDVWLAADRTIDDQTHAHSLEYWKDPDLEAVRQAIVPLQVRLAKVEDAERKRLGIEHLVKTLQAVDF